MNENVSRLALSLAVEQLEAAYAKVRARLQAQIDDSVAKGWVAPGDLVPEVMCDSNSRYILLDSLTAIVTAQAVLAR